MADVLEEHALSDSGHAEQLDGRGRREGGPRRPDLARAPQQLGGAPFHGDVGQELGLGDGGGAHVVHHTPAPTMYCTMLVPTATWPLTGPDTSACTPLEAMVVTSPFPSARGECLSPEESPGRRIERHR